MQPTQNQKKNTIIQIKQNNPDQNKQQNQPNNSPRPINQIITCQFYLVRKNRRCKFQIAPGSKYCHAHCSDLQNKIQCPYQKGFFIDKSKYQKHMQNCPRIRDKQKEKDSIWYNEDINKNNQEIKENQNKQHNLPKALKQAPENLKMIHKIIKLFLLCFKGQQTHFIQSTQKQSLVQKTNDHMQAYLIAQKAYNFGLISQKYIYVQFGAGKGILSYAIANRVKQQTLKHSKNILLQKQSRRNKFDRFFKDNPFFQRYKSDVSDFDFGLLTKTMITYAKQKCNNNQIKQDEIKQLQNSQMIGICKHMCGQALDISVRGLLKANCKGNILASCCHHLCNYNTYLNPKFFKEHQWTAEQTQIMFKMSSWGTRAYQLNQQDLIIPTLTEKVIIGRMCKRLIDYGRAQILNGKLQRYCSDQLTPENYVIISN